MTAAKVDSHRLRPLVLTFLELAMRQPPHGTGDAREEQALAKAEKVLQRYQDHIRRQARDDIWQYVYMSLEEIYRAYRGDEIKTAIELQGVILKLADQLGIPVSEEQLDEMVPAADELAEEGGPQAFAEKASAAWARLSARTLHNSKMVRRSSSSGLAPRRASGVAMLRYVIDGLLESASTPPGWWSDEADELLEIRDVLLAVRRKRNKRSIASRRAVRIKLQAERSRMEVAARGRNDRRRR